MSDLISRQAAIETATYGNPQTAWQRIEALPSIQPEPKWIPVSERLPDTPDAVLVTIDWGDGDYEVSTDEYWSIDGVATEGWGNLHGEVVIAWMPLPEPYKGEQE